MTLLGDAINTAPVAANKTIVTNEDTAGSVTMTATDSDVPAQTLSYSIFTNPAHGTVAVVGSTVTYTPALNYSGSDSFTYRAFDGIAYSATATVSVTVNAVNDAPVLSGVSDTYSIPELSAFTFTATAADVDSGSLTYSLTSAPSGASINSSTGVFTWTPTEAQGPASYTFSVVVSDGSLSDTKSVTIDVTEVNLAPVLNTIGNQSGTEEVAMSFTVSGSDADLPAQTLTYSASGLPTGATFDTGTGAFSWTPTFEQSGTYNVTFTVSDGTLTDTEIVPITIGSVNRPPVLAAIGDKSVNENSLLSFTVTANDPDADSVTLAASGLPTGATFDTGTGAFSWTPDYTQAGTYSVTFTVTDSNSATDEETIVINVNNVNRAPTAADQATTTDEDVAVNLTLTAADEDTPAQTLIFAINNPSHGTLSNVSTSTGAVTYTPALNYFGTDLFTYTVTDGESNSSSATVSITINSVNDAPVISLNGDSTVAVIAGNTYNEDGAVCTDVESEGDLSVNISGTVNTSEVGTYTVTYSCTDSNEQTSSVTRTVTVQAAPAACMDGIDNDEDGKIDFGGEDGDPGCTSPTDNSEADPVVIPPAEPTPTTGGGLLWGPTFSTIAVAPQGQVLGASTSCGLNFTKSLRRGFKNDTESVKKLQQFLNEHISAGLTESGVFDSATENALKAFQLKYASTILTPWGLTAATGVLHTTTRTQINNLMCPDLKLPIPTQLIPMTRKDL